MQPGMSAIHTKFKLDFEKGSQAPNFVCEPGNDPLGNIQAEYPLTF